MTPIVALLLIALISTILIRVGTLALTMTGLSQDASSFQSLSAFFGVGFTTRESELVMSHPVRRRIIRDLIICGNIGLTGVLATVIATAVQADFSQTNWVRKLGILIAGLAALYLVGRLGFVRRAIDWSIRASLMRAGVVRAMDYDMLLRVASGYSIAEVELDAGHPLINRTLGETRLRGHGIVVLGITREGGEYVGVPKGDTRMLLGDELTVYGQDAAVRALSEGTLDLGIDAPAENETGRTDTR